MGRLVTASPNGVPHSGLYPYWQGDGVVELHLHKDDEQLVDLAARARIAAGQALDAVKAAGLPDEWAEWGTGFINTERWLETVYQSLTNGAGSGQADASHGGNYGRRDERDHDHDH